MAAKLYVNSSIGVTYDFQISSKRHPSDVFESNAHKSFLPWSWDVLKTIHDPSPGPIVAQIALLMFSGI